jgi:flagellin
MTESVYAQVRVARVERASRQSMRKLSSGTRISSAADAAADLGISEKMRAHVKSAHAAQRNTQDGISMLNVLDGALGEVTQKVARLRELAIQSASEVLADPERQYIQKEYISLSKDIDRVTGSADFNGLDLLSGGNTTVSVQVGISASGVENRVRVRLRSVNANTLGLDVTRVDSAADAQNALKRLDGAIDIVNGFRAEYGANQNQLGSSLRNLENWTENIVDAESRIRDTDIAVETANLTRQQVFRQVGIAMLAQTGTSKSAVLSLIG